MRYYPALDGLRALAAICVVLFHCRGPETQALFGSGFLGVDVFFVLSGYLITQQLRDGRTLGEFYARRALRLLPALLFFLAAYLAVAPLLWPGQPHARDAMFAGLYLSDITLPLIDAPKFLQHTWSLAVEAQFYLLWPLVFFLVRKRPVLLIGALYLLLTTHRIFTPQWVDAYYRPDTHSTGLLLGALLAYVPYRHPAMAWAGLGTLAVALLTGEWRDQFTLDWVITLTELGSALLILGMLEGGKVAAGLSVFPLRWMGLMSYGIYLWHYPIARLARDEMSSYAAAGVTLLASTLLAALSFYTVERVRHLAKRPAIEPAVAP